MFMGEKRKSKHKFGETKVYKAEEVIGYHLINPKIKNKILASV